MASQRTESAFSIAAGLALTIFLLTAVAISAGGTITWSATGGPTGGSINALAVPPDAPGIVYAGTHTGVFISRDSGANWNSVSNGLPDNRAITALALTSDAKIVFAGTQSGIYKTTNSGENWTNAAAALSDQFVLSLVMDPQNQNIIYAGTLTTVFKSDNAGETWKDSGDGLRPVRVSALALDSAIIYAATDAGIFISRDRGNRWLALNEGLGDGARPQAIAVSSKGALVGTTQGLYRWRDNRWTRASGDLAGTLVRPLVVETKRAERVFAATLKGIFRSSDGGDTWSALSAIPGESSLHAFASDPKIFFAGTSRGMWASADEGKSWNPLNEGLVSTSVSDLIATPGALFAATQAGLAFSNDQGKTWREVAGLGDTPVLSLSPDPTRANVIYAGALNGAIFISRDAGASFTRVADNVGNSPISALAAIPLANDARVLYAGTLGGGLYRSADEGKTWNVAPGNLNATRINALRLISSTLYAATDRGLFRVDHTNPAAAWQLASPDLPPDEARQIASDPRNPQTVYALLAARGIFRSEDGGARWHALGKGTFPTRGRFLTFAVSASNGSLVYVGTDRGMYRSDDNGETWLAANEGLPPGTQIAAIAIDPALPQRVYIGTDGYGVLMGAEEARPTGNNFALPAAIAGAVALAAGVVVIAWRTRFSPAAQERAWTHEWPLWENTIQHALWTFGQANEVNLTRLPRRKLFRALQRYKDQQPDDALSLHSAPVLALKLDNYLPAQKFLSLWKAAWEVVENEESFQSVTSQMVDQLCQMLGFTRVDERSFQGMMGYVVKAPTLRLKIPPRFPIIFIPKHDITQQDIGVVRDLMNVLNMTSYFALIIDLRDAPSTDTRPTLKRLAREAVHDFIVLDGVDIRRLLAARDYSRRLVDIILDQVDLTVVSPYVTSGPVPDNMFFGRDYEIKTIVRTARDTNFAIVGGRKIGKTSVLARVNKLLQDMPDFQPFYLDCQAIHTHAGFFEAVDTLWTAHLPAHTPEGFRRMAIDLGVRYPGKIVVMLFDEIDGLLKHDIAQGEQLFQILRALAQEASLRYVFCGEKVLNASLRDARLVFFNFCNILRLTYLNSDEALRVVQEPLEEMGVALEDDAALAAEIVKQSARHPNIIQYLCQELIKRINARRERMITRADVNALTHSTHFTDYVVEITWGNANALERLLTVLLLTLEASTLPELAEQLRANGLEIANADLERALEGLCLYSILKKDGPAYTFATETFPAILRRTQDLKGLNASLLAELSAPQGNPA